MFNCLFFYLNPQTIIITNYSSLSDLYVCLMYSVLIYLFQQRNVVEKYKDSLALV